MQNTRRLYYSSVASANSAAYIDVNDDATLVGIAWTISQATVTTGDRCNAELSIQSTAQPTTNDALGIISQAEISYAMTTSGAAIPAVNIFHGPLQYKIQKGTRLYLHTTQSGTNATRIQVTLHLK